MSSTKSAANAFNTDDKVLKKKKEEFDSLSKIYLFVFYPFLNYTFDVKLKVYSK